jgi:hypothetical protein
MRPTARLVSSRTDPTCSFEAPGAAGSIAQVWPSALAHRMLAGPPPTTTTSDWNVTAGFGDGP